MLQLSCDLVENEFPSVNSSALAFAGIADAVERFTKKATTKKRGYGVFSAEVRMERVKSFIQRFGLVV